MTRVLRAAAAMVTFVVGAGLVGAGPVSATPTAFVKIVDRYDHGRIEIGVNGVIRRMSYGEVKGPFEVQPDSMHNDGITLRSLRRDGCGIAKIGYYFRNGHHYRIVVWPHGYHCGNTGPLGPDARVVDVTT